MNFNKALKLFSAIIICELAAVVGSVFTVSEIKGWYSLLEKPTFNPPNWIFGPVWSILFLLMGVSLYFVWVEKFEVKNQLGITKKKAWNEWSEKLWVGEWQKINIVVVFALQLVLNILWSVIFFGMHNPGLAFFELLILWFSIIYTILNFYRVSKIAAYLLIPYILWVSFAGVLNLVIWLLN